MDITHPLSTPAIFDNISGDDGDDAAETAALVARLTYEGTAEPEARIDLIADLVALELLIDRVDHMAARVYDSPDHNDDTIHKYHRQAQRAERIGRHWRESIWMHHAGRNPKRVGR